MTGTPKDYKKLLPIGIDNYEKLITQDCIFIDKTLLIKEWWENKTEVTLVTRPRRFGKSLALSMLRYFFEKGEESTAHLFKNSKIWQEPGFKELQGTYPVIHLSFKEVEETTWDAAYEQITELLVEELERIITPFASSLSPLHKRQYEALITQTASPIQFGNCLKFMSKVLELHYKKKVIILIDEYDTPITHAYLNKYYKKMVAFMKKLFSSGLKSNKHLYRGFMTGIVRTAKDGILSGLNNPKICTLLDKDYSDKFGFTETEVSQLLQITNCIEKKEEVAAWYNGYIVGVKYAEDPATSFLCSKIYNPWSVLQYIASACSPETYWVNTASSELLEKLIAESDSRTQEELTILLTGDTLEHKKIDQDVTLLDLGEKKQEPWSFLLFAGYLTTTSHLFQDNEHFYTLSIPNKEIAQLYKKLVLKTLERTFSSLELKELLQSITEGHISLVGPLLEKFVESLCSYHDLPKNNLEQSLHLFVLGLLASLSTRYIIKSNLESGKGRYDILMLPKLESDLAVIFEFKKGEANTLEDLATKALEQIKTNHYQKQLQDLGYKGKILCYGVAIFKKQLVAKMCIL